MVFIIIQLKSCCETYGLLKHKVAKRKEGLKCLSTYNQIPKISNAIIALDRFINRRQWNSEKKRLAKRKTKNPTIKPVSHTVFLI